MQLAFQHTASGTSRQCLSFYFHGYTGQVEKLICLHAIEHLQVPEQFVAAVAAIHRKDHRTLMQNVEQGLIDPLEDYAPPQSTTLLHEASFVGHLEAARILVLTGADLLRQDVSGQTPLEVARVLGHHEICTFLEAASDEIALVAGLNVTDIMAREAARQNESSDGWRTFPKDTPLGQGNQKGQTALRGAAVVEELQRSATPLDIQEFAPRFGSPAFRDPETGDALIHVAVNAKQYDFALGLIDHHNVPVDSLTLVGETAVSLIVTRCCLEGWFPTTERIILQELLKRGASSRTIDLFGRMCRAEFSSDCRWPIWTTSQLSDVEIEQENTTWWKQQERD
eukprot:m.43643 g.43643  ORF g.43643 m.43643 type:complete len:339 (-) comp8456_c0_seq1:3588-4604(-)